MILLLLPLFYIAFVAFVAHFSISGAVVLIALGMIASGAFAASWSN